MPHDRSPITVDDLYQLDWLEDPRFSPDARQVAFVRVSVDREGNRYRRDLAGAHRWPAGAALHRRREERYHAALASRWATAGILLESRRRRGADLHD